MLYYAPGVKKGKKINIRYLLRNDLTFTLVSSISTRPNKYEILPKRLLCTSRKPFRINTLYSYHAGPFLARLFTRRLLAVCISW